MQADWWVGWTPFLLGEILKSPGERRDFFLVFFFCLVIFCVYTIAGWWFGTWLIFFQILGIIIPTDFHIFQRVEATNQIES
jgi:hypothetical protein